MGARRNAFLAGAAALLLAGIAPASSQGHDALRFEGSGVGALKEDVYMASLTPAARLKAGAVSAVNCVAGMAGVFPCKNVDLLAYLDTNVAVGITASDIEGWTDPVTLKEWVIQGHSDATTFIDVSNPELPLIFGTLPPAVPSVLWRELEVYNNHVYIVQDLVGAGLQIFDLTKLRSALPGVVFTPLDYSRDTSFGRAHTITINPDTGFAYVNGSNMCSAGPRMFDLKPDPKVPVFVGCVSADGYTHDNQCVVYRGPDTTYTGREICAMYNEDTLTMFDVTNKSAPAMLSRVTYPGTLRVDKYTHQGWFTEDQRYILLDDELDENGTTKTTTYLWNMTDLDSPVLIAPWQHQTTCTDHNQFIIGRFAYQSNYACGLRIMDVSNVAAGTLTEVAYFDTAPAHDFIPGASDGGDLDGDWANYPYFRSGIVVTSNISKGLFVLRPRLPGPTAVTIASFTAATRSGRGVALRWRTASEIDTLGFDVWRFAPGGAGVKVNRRLIPAKAYGGTGGGTYRLVDSRAGTGVTYRYRLQIVSRDGRHTWRATTRVRVR